jgi:hypothetical protein
MGKLTTDERKKITDRIASYKQKLDNPSTPENIKAIAREQVQKFEQELAEDDAASGGKGGNEEPAADEKPADPPRSAKDLTQAAKNAHASLYAFKKELVKAKAPESVIEGVRDEITAIAEGKRDQDEVKRINSYFKMAAGKLGSDLPGFVDGLMTSALRRPELAYLMEAEKPAPKPAKEKPAPKPAKPKPAPKPAKEKPAPKPAKEKLGANADLEECKVVVAQANKEKREKTAKEKLEAFREKKIEGGMSKEDADKLTLRDLPKPPLAQAVSQAAETIVGKVVSNKLAKVSGVTAEDRDRMREFRDTVEKETAANIAEYARRVAEEGARRINEFAQELKKHRAE